jgi:hypothetical protein
MREAAAAGGQGTVWVMVGAEKRLKLRSLVGWGTRNGSNTPLVVVAFPSFGDNLPGKRSLEPLHAALRRQWLYSHFRRTFPIR